MPGYVELHCHSAYSFLDGASQPEELAVRAAELGYEVVGVAGSSMGALVGGLHAAGSLDEFAEWATTLTQRAVLRLLDPSITAAGVLRAEKILDAVRDILGDATIDTLPIPYTAVTTDLIAGKSVAGVKSADVKTGMDLCWGNK